MASTYLKLPLTGGGGGGVTSFNGRTGGVVPVAGDYNAIKITNVPAGTIAATNVQAALNELDGDISGKLSAANNLSDLGSATTARANLGLGTLATQNGTFSGTSSGTNTGDQTNISGNAATVTTNANLTGAITSTGNATSLGSFSSTQLKTALTDETGSGSSVFSNSATMSLPTFDALTLDGNISRGIAFDSSGHRVRNPSAGLLTISDTVSAASTIIAQASVDTLDSVILSSTNAITITNLIGTIVRLPSVVAPTTLTNSAYALGAESLVVGTAAMASLDYSIDSTVTKAGIFTSQNSNNSPGGLTLNRSSATLTNSAVVNLSKSKGTTASKTAVATSDILGEVNFLGYTGNSTNGYAYGARIRATTTETTPGTAAMGSKLDFLTTPAGSITSAVALSLASDKTATVSGNIVSTLGATSGISDTAHFIANNTVNHPTSGTVSRPMVDYSVTNTVSGSGNFSFLGAGFLFWNRGTWTDSSAAANTMGPAYTVVSQPTINMTHSTGAKTFIGFDYLVSPTINCTGGGTASGAYTQMSLGGTVGANVTATTRTAATISEFAGSGSVTNNIGLSFAAMSKATNSTAILIGTTTAQTGNFSINSQSTYPQLWSSGHRWARRSVSGTTATLTTADGYLVMTDNTGTKTATLPDATTCTGIEFIIKRTQATGVVNVTSVSSQTFDGAASPLVIAATANNLAIVRSNGANWEVLKNGAP